MTEKLSIQNEAPTENKIAKAIKAMQNNKAPGIDGISVVIWKIDIDTTNELLHSLIKAIRNSETGIQD